MSWRTKCLSPGPVTNLEIQELFHQFTQPLILHERQLECRIAWLRLLAHFCSLSFLHVLFDNRQYFIYCILCSRLCINYQLEWVGLLLPSFLGDVKQSLHPLEHVQTSIAACVESAGPSFDCPCPRPAAECLVKVPY